MKEIRVTPNIEEHDFEFKAKNARKFLTDGNKVKITVRFRGREVNNSKAGDVYFFDYKKTPSHINWQGSAHEVEMLQTLNIIDMNKDLPTTNVLGVIPKRIGDDTTFELSNEIITAVKTMEEVIIKYLLNLDIKMKIKNEDATIENISLISFKRDIINGPKI